MSWPKIVIFILLMVFFGSYVATKIALPMAEDLPRQMANGRDILQGNFAVITKNYYSYTQPNQPFANHHWFYGIMAYVMYLVVGWMGMGIFRVVFVLVTFSLLFYLAQKQGNFWLAAFFALPTILLLLGRTNLRPELFSYFFIVLTLWLLLRFEKNPGGWGIFWLVPLEILWVNTHLYFAVGIMMAAGFLFERFIVDHEGRPVNRFNREGLRVMVREAFVVKLLGVILLMSMCIFINPFGLDGVVFSLKVNKDQDFPIASQELAPLSYVLKNNPPMENIPPIMFKWLAGILAASFLMALTLRWRLGRPLFMGHFIFFLLGGAATVALGIYIIRAIPLLGYMFLPAICANLKEAPELFYAWFLKKSVDFQKFVSFAAFAVLVALIAWLTVGARPVLAKYSIPGFGITDQTENLVKFIKANNLRGPIFNDTDIGSYLIFYLHPKEKVFSDNRFGDAYSAPFFANVYNPAFNDPMAWPQIASNYQFNLIIINQYDGGNDTRNFLNRMFGDKNWTMIYADTYSVMFIRNSPENKDIIKKYAITQENLAERLAPLANSSDINDQLAAADVESFIGRIDLYMPQYLRVVSSWPNRGKVWFALGRAELSRPDMKNSSPDLAAIYLQRAIASGWVTADTYSYLALAYFRTGQYDRAREAVERELKIDPESEDAKKWIGILAGK